LRTSKLRLAALALMAAASTAQADYRDDLTDGDRYFEAEDYPKAAAAFDRAIAKAPGQVPPEAYYKRSVILFVQKRYKEGLDFIQKAKARHPTAPDVLGQEAVFLWASDRRDDAVKIAEQVVSDKPSLYTNQKLIGQYYAGRDYGKTRVALEAYLANRPGTAENEDVMPRINLGFAYVAAARLALGDGDETKAQQMYGKAVGQFEILNRKHAKQPNAKVNAENGLCAAYTGMGRFDQAVTVCERITGDPRRIDAQASAWFNLATAYLARKQGKKARTAANEFIKVRKGEARGFILVGDTYFADREWNNALEQYTRGEQLLKPNQAHEQIQLSIRLGKTYRRLTPPKLTLAVEKLSAAYAANPASLELAVELGSAYLDARQDQKATALTDKLVADASFAKAPAEARANVFVLSGKTLFNQRKLKEARQRFEAAQQLKPSDVTIQRALVLVINEQAFEAGKDVRAAQQFLEQSLAIDAASPVTITNLAVLAIDRGDCDGARGQLAKLENIRGHDTVVRTRLHARTYLCGARPDTKKAAEAYAIAEREAKKANATTALAEIYTEWAPLTWDTDLNGAIDKLEIAVQTGGQDPEVGPPAKRNLAIALYRHGWRLMRENKASEAAADFERAVRDPSVLKGAEPLAFEFSYAMALLDGNRAGEAARLLKTLAAKGNQSSYLKPPYAKVGTQFFAAYAAYRNGTLAARQQAAAEFARLENEPGFGEKVRELLGSTWESIGYEQWRSGQGAQARRAFANAEKYATSGDLRRRVMMDRVALSLGKNDLAALEGMNGSPPESLVNLGIVYEMLGKPREAYDAWVRARARGIQSPYLTNWIEAKKRIYGY
jgi:Flp pilus assembly protein TadD